MRMKMRRLAGLFAVFLAATAGASAQGPIPQDPYPVDPVSAILPKTPSSTPDRPNELPNIDPRSDIVPLFRDPANSTPVPRPRWTGPRSDYDPSYNFLPDSNPGLRQPPCPCLPLGTWWFNGAFFLGKTENNAAPPLVTQGGSGIPGAPGVSILQGNQNIDHPFSSGFRLETGIWMDRCQTWGIEGSFFYLTQSDSNISASSGGNPLLARPFVAQPGSVPSAAIVAAPGVSDGWITVDSPLSFMGADVNARVNLFCEDRVRLDFLSGYRFIRLAESLNVHSYSDTFSGPATGSTTEILDSFHTVNYFNGGQIGLAGEYRFDRLFLAGSMKVAFGVNSAELDVSGWTRTQAPGGAPVTAPTGLLTQSTNSISTTDHFLSVVPEANFAVGYQINDRWRALIGYTFIYINNVARPGQIMDSSIGAGHPAILTPNGNLWMQGINFAIEARF